MRLLVTQRNAEQYRKAVRLVRKATARRKAVKKEEQRQYNALRHGDLSLS